MVKYKRQFYTDVYGWKVDMNKRKLRFLRPHSPETRWAWAQEASENMETWIRGMVCLRWMTTIRQLNLRKDPKLDLKLDLKLHLKLDLKLWGTDKVALWMFALTWVKQGHETNQALDSHIGSFLLLSSWESTDWNFVESLQSVNFWGWF